MNLGVLVSGEGTNLQALIDAGIPIAVVIANKPDAHALVRAARAGIAHEVVEHRGLERIAFEDRMLAVLAQHRVEAVVLAGFMRVLTPHFVDHFPGRLINTHPSLLPAFPGADAVAQALAHGVKLAGVTVHFVDHSLDGGPIIAQAAVPVRDDDTESTLAARVLAEEHRLLPQAIRWFAEGRLVIAGGRVRVTGEP